MTLVRSPVKLRVATSADAHVIAGIVVSAFKEYSAVIPPLSALQETPESIAAKFDDPSEAYIAEVDGIAVGCVFFEFKPDPDRLYLSRLAVLSEYRGCGIARVLINAVEQTASERGLNCVRLGTRTAITRNVALYEHLGYRAYEYATHEGFTEHTVVLMEKLLV
jgi:ribosomal protein S18 acetylase RimI-like enzyme